MVSAIILAALGSSVTGMNGRAEVAEVEGVTADDGVSASSEGATLNIQFSLLEIYNITPEKLRTLL